MGLGFIGGFAGGMSDSIEKSRDRLQKQKKLDNARIAADEKLVRDNEKKQYELSTATREAFDEINEKIQKIKTGDAEMSDSEAVSTVNYLQKQKLDIYKKAMDYGMKIGVKGADSLVDLTKEGIEYIGTVTEGGDKYVINNELAKSIKDSNGQLVRQGDEVMNQVMEQDTNGQWKPIKNPDGTQKYESTGVKIKKFSDIFQKKKDSSGSSNEERYIQDYLNVNVPDDATDEQISSARMTAAKSYRNMIKPSSVKEMETKNNAVKFGNSFIQQKYATTLDKIDFSIVSKNDKKKLAEHADIGIRMVMGNKAPELNAEVKSLENRTDKMAEASSFLQKKIESGEDVNLFRNTVSQYFSSFFGYSDDEAERVANNKTIVNDLNQQRHALYGSVLTKGENANYTQQASSLFRSNKDLFIATKRMVKDNVEKLEEIEAKIGEDLFKMKFGDTLVQSKKRLSNLNSAETKKETAVEAAKRRRDAKEPKNSMKVGNKVVQVGQTVIQKGLKYKLVNEGGNLKWKIVK